MVTHYRKKLIEVALPLTEINDASAYDKMPGIGPHPKGIHHWWARLPLPTARSVLFASVVDDPSSNPEKFPTDESQNKERQRLFGIVRELMQKKMHEHPEIFTKARSEMLKHCDGKLPELVDPFAGGGSIPLEAARFGFATHAFDLNPVAVLLNKCNLEIVPRWGNYPSINPESRKKMASEAGLGASGLASDVRYYADLIRKRAVQVIGNLYPMVKLPVEYGGREANVIAWLWARTVRCPNPACGARAPMVRSFLLSKNSRNRVHAKPVFKNKHVAFTISVEGEQEKETTSGKGARCLFCGQTISKVQLRQTATAHGVYEIPLAVVADVGRGRVYLPSEATKLQHIDRPDVPSIEQDMTNDRRWFSPPLYGLPKFSDLFTPRQLTVMVTLSDLIKAVRKDVMKDASDTLSEKEAREYCKSISVFLALALDRCADFNNSLCRWTAGNQKVMNLFGRQAIPMVWDFAEANTLGDGVGAWSTCSNYVADCIDVISKMTVRNGNAKQIDAANSVNGLRNVLVSTDPPYYDNIGYAVLSDFFYTWLRNTLGDLYPELFGTILVPKEAELTATAERFQGDKQKAKAHFERGFRKAFSALRESMDGRYPLTVYYAFKQEDEASDDNDVDDPSLSTVSRTTGWETLLEALLGSGFQITATWPVRASQKWRMVAMGTNALASYIVLACRARPKESPECSRREFMNELKKELPAALRHLQQGSIAPVDLAQASIGPGMAVFSRYSKIIESSGHPMTVRTALALINQTLDEVITEQEGDFDADTRWALAWFDQYGIDAGPYGVAETLSKAKNATIKGLEQAGIVQSRGGKVQLIPRNDLQENWDPASDRRLTIWEVSQYLIRALQAQGESRAAVLLRKVRGTGEIARELSYRLYTICERKKWVEEAQAYNSLVVAWPEITKLAQGIRSPEQMKIE